MHRTCFLKTTNVSETMKTRKGSFDINNLTRDQLRIINTSLQPDCIMIVCSRCKGNINIRKLLNKLVSVVTKTTVRLDQYEEKLKEMETKLDYVKERIVEVEKATHPHPSSAKPISPPLLGLYQMPSLYPQKHSTASSSLLGVSLVLVA